MKKARVFSPTFKAAAVRRMQGGESPSALARSLKLRRKLLYEWRNAVLAKRPLRTAGRPRKGMKEESSTEPVTDRIRELEQIVGQLTVENRFFKGALRRIKELRRPNAGVGGAASLGKSKP